ncbi:MAG: hypothetical protein M3270_04435 [Thermoproteota archaeon]|nr:hypothetical protein [Thermoproteota archaeon]
MGNAEGCPIWYNSPVNLEHDLSMVLATVIISTTSAIGVTMLAAAIVAT